MLTTKKIHVHYVAILREHIGASEEIITTTACDVADLYNELSKKHRLPWPVKSIRPAVNDSLTNWECVLHDNDNVIFLPPSSGG